MAQNSFFYGGGAPVDQSTANELLTDIEAKLAIATDAATAAAASATAAHSSEVSVDATKDDIEELAATADETLVLANEALNEANELSSSLVDSINEANAAADAAAASATSASGSASSANTSASNASTSEIGAAGSATAAAGSATAALSSANAAASSSASAASQVATIAGYATTASNAAATAGTAASNAAGAASSASASQAASATSASNAAGSATAAATSASNASASATTASSQAASATSSAVSAAASASDAQTILDEIHSSAGVTSFNTRNGSVTLLSADVTGALGFTPYNATNPSGYITSSASITGNAATATKLATARAINGVSFDGTADISITAVAGSTIWTQANLTNNNQLTNGSGFITSSASISGNAATATKLATGRLINGVAFDGTANITITATDPAYTASDVLTKIKTVDGAGSGLDADLLDGLNSTAFLLTTDPVTTATANTVAKRDSSGNLIASSVITESTLVGRGGASEGGQVTLGYGGGAATGISGQGNSTWNIDVDNTNTLRVFRQNSSGVALVPLSIAESTGNITATGSITAPATGFVLDDAAGTNRYIRWRTAGLDRWAAVAGAAVEGGSNTGSNWVLQRYNDAGAVIDNPISIARLSGIVTMPNSIATGNATHVPLSGDAQLLVGSTSPALTASGRGLVEITGSSSSLLGFKIGGTTQGYLFASGTEFQVVAAVSNPLVLAVGAGEAARIDASKRFLVGKTSSPGNHKLDIDHDGSTTNGVQINDTGAAGVPTSLSIVTRVSDTLGAVVLSAGGVQKFFILRNGNVQNASNSYGAISDIKLKQDVVAATPKLAALRNVRIVNYALKEEPDLKQIGVIAQELEQVFPGMVSEQIDRDAEGNDLGTVTKSVKYSVFVPILIKAVQELSAQVDSLQTRLEALENR